MLQIVKVSTRRRMIGHLGIKSKKSALPFIQTSHQWFRIEPITLLIRVKFFTVAVTWLKFSFTREFQLYAFCTILI